MKLLLADQYGEMGGAQRCLLEAAAGFAEQGWELHALIPEGALEKSLEKYCRSVQHLRCGPFASGDKTVADAARFAWQIPRQAARIARSAASRRVDAIYVNGPRLLPAASLGRAGRPLVYHSHWMVPQSSAAALARTALRASGASVIATSRAAAEWLNGCVPASRVSTIYNGVAGFNAPIRSRNAVRHLALLGRISAEKGQLEFVRAVRMVHRSAPDLRFTVRGASLFTGDAYFEQVRREAAGLPIEFAEWTEDVGAFLSGVDLLAVPSSGIDNIPRVIMEAFAAGVPVLAFASGAIPELIEHGETGLLAADSTAEGLAAAILEASSGAVQLDRIAARAHQRWQERYTLRRFQADVREAVECAARRHRKPLASAGASAAA